MVICHLAPLFGRDVGILEVGRPSSLGIVE